MLSRPRAPKPCSVCLSLPDSRVVPAEDTVIVTFGRRRVPAIEICGEHRAELAKVLEPYLAAGADAHRRRSAAGLGRGALPLQPHEDLEAIRTWALDEGLPVSRRGGVSHQVIERYRAAHRRR
ncbi:MAG: Lsr2 [Frankiaceae bacterium]|nr:Lsr2 [Frankiaceae bacterium]MDQ1724848.1 Lsr2 [Frankiaceae bacterium]